MRRDYYSLEVRGTDLAETVDEPPKPTLHIEFTGPTGALDDLIATVRGDGTDAVEGDVDVAYRLQTTGDVTDRDAEGVLSLTDRVTGDYLLEVDVDGGEVVEFVRAARDYGEATSDEGRYCVRVVGGDETVLSDEKSTLLVYDAEGRLLRQHSLIPSGVEL